VFSEIDISDYVVQEGVIAARKEVDSRVRVEMKLQTRVGAVSI
jgi:hypothetical protein